MPFFYSFTGCDMASSYYGKGKRKAYDVWVKSERRDDFFDDFVELGEKPTDVISDHIDMLNSFVLQLYGLRQNTLSAAWLDRFKSPQVKTCAYYHQGRKLYTTIFIVLLIKLGIWEECLEELDIPDPEQWGWKTDSKGDFQPLWMTTKSSVAVKNFIETCSCKTGKCKSCECANVACLSMCGCGRGCIWTFQ